MSFGKTDEGGGHGRREEEEVVVVLSVVLSVMVPAVSPTGRGWEEVGSASHVAGEWERVESWGIAGWNLGNLIDGGRRVKYRGGERRPSSWAQAPKRDMMHDAHFIRSVPRGHIIQIQHKRFAVTVSAVQHPITCRHRAFPTSDRHRSIRTRFPGSLRPTQSLNSAKSCSSTPPRLTRNVVLDSG